jgi:hypothetical protein
VNTEHHRDRIPCARRSAADAHENYEVSSLACRPSATRTWQNRVKT